MHIVIYIYISNYATHPLSERAFMCCYIRIEEEDTCVSYYETHPLTTLTTLTLRHQLTSLYITLQYVCMDVCIYVYVCVSVCVCVCVCVSPPD